MVMGSYNTVNGTYASANRYLLTDVLKQGWQFDGMVTSDWGGVHETASVQAGNDLEMPNRRWSKLDKLKAALADGTVTQAAVDDSARRILRTLVVLNNGTPITMNGWIDRTPGVLEAWLPGQEGGAALAAIIFGEVNPSGRLPDTLAFKRADYPDAPNFPGKDATVNYTEGIYIGYRHFDKQNIAPLFPFGYGLSYTTFSYGNLRMSSPSLRPDGEVSVSLDLTNTGQCDGEETVQLYVHDF